MSCAARLAYVILLTAPLSIVVSAQNCTPAQAQSDVPGQKFIDGSGPVAVEPGIARDHLLRGIAHGQKGEVDRAIAEFTESIRLKPDPVAFYSRGVAYTQKGDPDHAISDFTEALVLKPDYVDAMVNRASAYRVKGDVDRSITEYTAAIRLKPDYAVAILNRGGAYLAKGAYDSAITDFNEVVRLQPNYGPAFFQRAAANQKKGDIDGAIADYSEGLKLQPEIPEGYLQRGGVYLQTDKFYKALDDFIEAVRRKRSFAKFLVAAVGERARAKILGGKSTGYVVSPGGAQGLVAVGAARFMQGKFTETVAHCDAAIQLTPNNADAHLLRGASLIGQGDIDRGIADLKEAERLDR